MMLLLLRASTVVASGATSLVDCSSALAQARALRAEMPDPFASSTTDGEIESHDWWEEHGPLFEAARLEFGELHPELYDLEAHSDEFINPELRLAVAQCEAAAGRGDAVPEEVVRALLIPAGAPGVWRFPLFTERFTTMLREEVERYEASGIPLRRPNGMNRFGVIMEHLGFTSMLEHLCRRYMRPLGQMLFPWLITTGTIDEHYGFIVRYKPGQDTSLTEHADASVVDEDGADA